MTADSGWQVIAEIVLGDPARARVYEHGWQSWSPAGAYPADLPASPRPRRQIWQTMAFRPERPAPSTGFQSEGLLVIDPGNGGPVRSWITDDPAVAVASIRAQLHAGRADRHRLEVRADRPVSELPPASSFDAALATAGERLASVMGARPIRPLDPGWCSWYGYGHDVSDEIVAENIAVIERERLDVRLVQIDDGYQADIGDWLEPSGRIESMAGLASRIRDGGRRAGIWTAPFIVGADSRLATDHPDWLVRDAVAAEHHWGQRVHVLDVTHPDVAAHLGELYRTLAAWGFTFHKLDFLYAGAMIGGRYGDADPIAAFREGLRIIREAVGDGATILGCGAPLLPSIGLVDAMRVSPDTDRKLEPPDGDISQPSLRSALAAGRARAWMHGRLWVNDPDCLIAAPDSEDRETWAAHVNAYGGLALSGDRLPELDARGLALTRTLLRSSSGRALRWLPDVGADGGRIEHADEAHR